MPFLCTMILGMYPFPLSTGLRAGCLIRGCWVVMHFIVDQLLLPSAAIEPIGVLASPIPV